MLTISHRIDITHPFLWKTMFPPFKNTLAASVQHRTTLHIVFLYIRQIKEVWTHENLRKQKGNDTVTS